MHLHRSVVGLVAHVDAGKTTLSEALLFVSGALRRQGRVDHGDAWLDTDAQEKERGITIFSKQALFHTGISTSPSWTRPATRTFLAKRSGPSG